MSNNAWKKEFIEWYGRHIDIDNLDQEAREHFNEMTKYIARFSNSFHLFFDEAVMGKNGERKNPEDYISCKVKSDEADLFDDIKSAVEDKDPKKMRQAMVTLYSKGMVKDLDAAQKYHEFTAEFQDDVLEVPEEAARIYSAEQKVVDDKKILDDYLEAAKQYQEAQANRKLRLDTELEDKKAELAQKKEDDKEFRRSVAKSAHPINFFARWSLRINYRIQQHSMRKEALEEFKSSQENERRDIQDELRKINEELTTVRNGYAERENSVGNHWQTSIVGKTQRLNDRIEKENKRQTDWETERAEAAEQRRLDEEYMEQRNKEVEAKDAYNKSFYESPSSNKRKQLDLSSQMVDVYDRRSKNEKDQKTKGTKVRTKDSELY